MRRGYKCDYCSEFNEDKEKMKEHEKDCSFNPIHKKCYSCNNQTYSYNGFECNLRVTEWCDYEEEGNCPKWEGDIKDVRKEKLKRLK